MSHGRREPLRMIRQEEGIPAGGLAQLEPVLQKDQLVARNMSVQDFLQLSGRFFQIDFADHSMGEEQPPTGDPNRHGETGTQLHHADSHHGSSAPPAAMD